MRPVRVFQCKGDCCYVQVPSRRFWYIQGPGGYKESASSFATAIVLADELARTVPTLEPSA